MNISKTFQAVLVAGLLFAGTGLGAFDLSAGYTLGHCGAAERAQLIADESVSAEYMRNHCAQAQHEEETPASDTFNPILFAPIFTRTTCRIRTCTTINGAIVGCGPWRQAEGAACNGAR